MKIIQEEMVENLLNKFKMLDCKGSEVLMPPGFVMDSIKEIIANVPYRELIGSLVYIVLGSRPD